MENILNRICCAGFEISVQIMTENQGFVCVLTRGISSTRFAECTPTRAIQGAYDDLVNRKLISQDLINRTEF